MQSVATVGLACLAFHAQLRQFAISCESPDWTSMQMFEIVRQKGAMQATWLRKVLGGGF